mmetsp:Transcript_11468/g.32534  ORF Transcript_11468/g.32534 Transcript_11468/m.32534 type:complete len:326 (+) Transcript_11468:325-1302(+)
MTDTASTGPQRIMSSSTSHRSAASSSSPSSSSSTTGLSSGGSGGAGRTCRQTMKLSSELPKLTCCSAWLWVVSHRVHSSPGGRCWQRMQAVGPETRPSKPGGRQMVLLSMRSTATRATAKGWDIDPSPEVRRAPCSGYQWESRRVESGDISGEGDVLGGERTSTLRIRILYGPTYFVRKQFGTGCLGAGAGAPRASRRTWPVIITASEACSLVICGEVSAAWLSSARELPPGWVVEEGRAVAAVAGVAGLAPGIPASRSAMLSGTFLRCLEGRAGAGREAEQCRHRVLPPSRMTSPVSSSFRDAPVLASWSTSRVSPGERPWVPR